MSNRFRYSIFPRDGNSKFSRSASSSSSASPPSLASSSMLAIDTTSWPLPPTRQDYIFSPHAPSEALSSQTTLDTPQTSIASSSPVVMRRSDFGPHELDADSDNRCVVSPDEWSMYFRSDSKLSGSIAANSMTDECPDRATLAAVQKVMVYDALGRGRQFGDLYEPTNALHPRQLIIFVRHFYCGACQAYLKALTRGITMRDYFSLPTPTNIIVIGCGQPDLITHYKAQTGCPFSIYADPTRALFKKLGMGLTINIGGRRPEYMHDISAPRWLADQVTSIHRSLRDPEGIRKRDVFRGGNFMQTGGEFLFENGQVIWCHRMRNYRDHVEVGEVRKILELDESD